MNNGFIRVSKFYFLIGLVVLLIKPSISYSQNNTPCNCTQRWTGGAHWNTDGSINDNSNNPGEHGLIRCGSSAENQSKLKPVSGCVYDSTAFLIDVSNVPAVDPSSGLTVYPINPTQWQPIIWLNFDVRALAGYFQIQINDNSGDNIAWALYYSTSITNGVSLNPNALLSDSISGDCSSLNLALAGVESSHTWNTLPVPNFATATNYYLAIWDQDADGQLWVNNFKARYGCGDAHIPNILCYLDTGDPYIQVYPTGNIYSVKFPVRGINNELYAYDPNSNNVNGLSTPVCLTNLGDANPHISDTLILDYNFGQDYNAIIFSAYDTLAPVSVIPDTLCAIPYNTGECKAFYTGSGTSLAIELLHFSGQSKDNEIELNWTTTTETNNDYFTIERSMDGKTFKSIGFVEGAGNSNKLLKYNYVDQNPLNKINYYRLRQTDFDGSISFSEIIQVFVNRNNNTLIESVYPNPFSSILNVTLSVKANENILLKILDITGAVVQEIIVDNKSGSTHQFNLSQIKKGFYFLQVEIESVSQTQKLIKY